jgi:hypothetical protein
MVTAPAIPQWIKDIKPVRPATNGHRNGTRTPAPPEIQNEFARLMARAGVQPERGNVLCPWHGDHAASLSVNWEAAVFCCHGCDEKGGLKRLRELVGEDLRKIHRPAGENPRPSPKPLQIDGDCEKLRLASGMKGAKLNTFNRQTGRSLIDDVMECRRAWRLYGAADGCKDKTTFSCGFPICPCCMPTRLKADFERHRANIPNHLDVYVWTPPTQCRYQREVADAFKRWRREQGLAAGFYGVRPYITNGLVRFDVLLILPTGGTFRMERYLPTLRISTSTPRLPGISTDVSRPPCPGVPRRICWPYSPK